MSNESGGSLLLLLLLFSLLMMMVRRGINCLREAGASVYSKHADHPDVKRKASNEPFSRIGTVCFPGPQVPMTV
jgi:hypothetical protein